MRRQVGDRNSSKYLKLADICSYTCNIHSIGFPAKYVTYLKSFAFVAETAFDAVAIGGDVDDVSS